jgi:2',3'-cyclic-nucleotide 2'-phosphodiesterase (5'-nucleotidase family)
MKLVRVAVVDIAWLCACALQCALAAVHNTNHFLSNPTNPNSFRLTLVHSHNFESEDGTTHMSRQKGGYPRWRTLMNTVNSDFANAPNVIRIHTGHALGTSFLGQNSKGAHEQKFMEELGFDILG